MEIYNPTVKGTLRGSYLQIPNTTLASGSWSSTGSIYVYSLTNSNIDENTIVDVIPDNSDIDIVIAAEFLPQTISSASIVDIFAKNIPTDDINVTLNLFK
jgi:hypothetical protein